MAHVTLQNEKINLLLFILLMHSKHEVDNDTICLLGSPPLLHNSNLLVFLFVVDNLFRGTSYSYKYIWLFIEYAFMLFSENGVAINILFIQSSRLL